MSGVKTVTMTTYERNRLVKQAAQATSLSVTNAALSRINAELNETVRNANARVTTLTSKLDSVNRALANQKKDADKQAEQLRQQLQQSVKDSNARLAAQAQQHQQELQHMQADFRRAIDATREEVAGAMAANNRRIEQVIAENNQVLQRQIDDVQTAVTHVSHVVDSMVSSDATLLAMARQYMIAAEELTQDSQTYRCELLLPGELAQVQAALAQAAKDVEESEKLPTNSAVARQNARQAYEAAQAFHERIVRAEQAWNLAHQAAAQAIAAARSQIEASRVVETTAGGRTARTDVESWSNGGISALTERADGLERGLGEENTLEDLQQIRAAAQQLAVDTQDAVVFAMGASICSQRRPDDATRLGRRIKEATGLNLVSYGYDGGDRRAAFRMVLKHPRSDMEIIVIQTPVVQPDGTIVNRLEHHVVNYGGNNMAVTDAQILAALELLGGGAIQTMPGYANCPSDLVTEDQVRSQLTETATTVATVPGGTGTAAKPAVGTAKQ